MILEMTFTSSHETNPSEYLYKAWFVHSQSLKPLGYGLERFPSSETLWLSRINACGNVQEKLSVFQKATLATESILIWKAYVDFGCEQFKYVDCKVIFEDAIASKLKGIEVIVEGYMKFVNGKFGIEQVRRLASDSDSVGIRKLMVEMEEECGQVDMKEVKRGYEWLHNQMPKDAGTLLF